MEKIVGVTGATGTIGRVLVKNLEKKGWKVRALIRNKINNQGDINDTESVERFIKGCDWVIHLAIYQNGMDVKYDNFEKVNVEGTDNLLKLAEKYKVKVLLVSSVAIYKDCGRSERDENWELNSQEQNNFYVRSKIEQLNLLKEFKDLKWIVAIPPVVLDLENIKKKTIPGGIMSALGKKDRMISVVGIKDLCEGIILCMEKGKFGEKYLLSSQNIKVADYIKKVSVKNKGFVLPFRIPIWMVSMAKSLIVIKKYQKLAENIIYGLNINMYFTSQKAKRELGYNPKWQL